MSELMENSVGFEAMMRQAGPRIYTLAVRLCGNVDDGHDLAQETFVKAYEHWADFRGEAERTTWLYRICVNAWKNRVRFERRRSFWKHFSLDSHDADSEMSAREIPSGERSQEDSLQKVQELEALHGALKEMKPPDRAILVLYEMEERSYEEIAGLLDVPIGTVRSRLARSREKLRDLLETKLKRAL